MKPLARLHLDRGQNTHGTAVKEMVIFGEGTTLPSGAEVNEKDTETSSHDSKGVFGSATKCNGMPWFCFTGMEWFHLYVWYE